MHYSNCHIWQTSRCASICGNALFDLLKLMLSYYKRFDCTK